MEKENVISTTATACNNLPPKQKAKQRYQQERAQMSMLRKLEVVEERLGQLQTFSEECLREVLKLLGEVTEASTSSGLGRVLERLESLQREYQARRAACLHRREFREEALRAAYAAQLQQIGDEGVAEEAESTVAILHRQRQRSTGGNSVMNSKSNSSTSLRKRSLPVILPPTTNIAWRGYRRPSVPVNLASSGHQVPSFVPAKKLSAAEADLLEIKGRLV